MNYKKLVGKRYSVRSYTQDPIEDEKLKNIAVFASGRGTNFAALIRAVKKGKIKANLSCESKTPMWRVLPKNLKQILLKD